MTGWALKWPSIVSSSAFNLLDSRLTPKLKWFAVAHPLPSLAKTIQWLILFLSVYLIFPAIRALCLLLVHFSVFVLLFPGLITFWFISIYLCCCTAVLLPIFWFISIYLCIWLQITLIKLLTTITASSFPPCSEFLHEIWDFIGNGWHREPFALCL